MSSIEVKGNRVHVRWREDGKQLRKSFLTREEAQRFQSTLPGPNYRGLGRTRRTRAQVIDVLSQNFEIDDNGCWLWTGALTNAAYGRFNWKHEDANVPGAHRVVLHAIGQRVPRDMVVDHLCRVRHCINPDHLEVVAQRENVLRSPIAPGAINAAKTHCPQGHEYSPENTYVQLPRKGRMTTGRLCKACVRARYLRSREQVSA